MQTMKRTPCLLAAVLCTSWMQHGMGQTADAGGSNAPTGPANSVFIGQSAGEKATPDSAFNTVIGDNAGIYLATNRFNTFVGFRAGSYCRADRNTCLGALTGTKLGVGEGNTFAGYAAGAHVSSGSRNTLIGNSAAGVLGSGCDNVMVGAGAGSQTRTASANVFIGKDAGMFNADGTGNVFLGHQAGLREKGSNRLYIANTGGSSPLIYGEFDRGRVGVNGSMGIRTNSPSSELHVVHANDPAAAGLRLQNAAGKGEHWRLFADKASGDLLIHSGGSTSTIPAARIDARSGEYRTASDARFKRDVTDLGSVLPRLLQLSPKTYHAADEATDKRRHVGLVADDVEPLFPEAVSCDAQDGTRYLNYGSIGVLAVQAIREQQAQIEALTRKVEQLEARLAAGAR